MDEWTAWAVRTMVLDSDQEVTRWVDVLEQAYEAVRNEGTLVWETLAERVSAAEDVNPTALEAFVREVGDSGRGVELVADIVAERNRFPELYWELVAPAEDAAEPLVWTSAEQRTRLAELWGDGWAEHLPRQLEYWWGQGWEQHPDEHKAAWLDPLLAELAAEQSAPESAAGQETVSAEQLSAAVVSAVTAVPGADQLSEKDMAEVMAQARARMEGAVR